MHDYMEKMVDDVRRDALRKVGRLSGPELETGWECIEKAAFSVLVSNEMSYRMGFLVLLDTIMRDSKDAFFKELLGYVVEGFEPALLAEAATNAYWADEPDGAFAMAKYMQLRGVLFMAGGMTTFEISRFFASLLPESVRISHADNMANWKKEAENAAEAWLTKWREEPGD